MGSAATSASRSAATSATGPTPSSRPRRRSTCGSSPRNSPPTFRADTHGSTSKVHPLLLSIHLPKVNNYKVPPTTHSPSSTAPFLTLSSLPTFPKSITTRSPQQHILPPRPHPF